MNQSSSVFILEDDIPTRNHLVDAINAADDLQICAETDTLEQARLWFARGLRADAAVIDLALPDGFGIELISEIATLPDAPAIIVSTVFGDDKNIVNAIRAGAIGYLLKESAPYDLVKSIRLVLSGGSPISPSIARKILKRFRDLDHSDADKTSQDGLSKRESEVLSWIVKGYSYREIAFNLNISVHTANTHVRHIYRKLAVSSRGEAVYKAITAGLVEL